MLPPPVQETTLRSRGAEDRTVLFRTTGQWPRQLQSTSRRASEPGNALEPLQVQRYAEMGVLKVRTGGESRRPARLTPIQLKALSPVSVASRAQTSSPGGGPKPSRGAHPPPTHLSAT